jgi:hypothetical protein
MNNLTNINESYNIMVVPLSLDIETTEFNVFEQNRYTLNSTSLRDYNNKKLVLNIIIGISFLLSISYIIYDNNKIIYHNLCFWTKKISEIF